MLPFFRPARRQSRASFCAIPAAFASSSNARVLMPGFAAHDYPQHFGRINSLRFFPFGRRRVERHREVAIVMTASLTCSSKPSYSARDISRRSVIRFIFAP
jgi:hypothetical protein